MMLSRRILPEERGRFALLATLFFINAMVLESNEVIATSGFISSIGVSRIVLVWALDMAIVIVTSGVYSLFVDRLPRGRLAVIVMVAFSLAYLALFGLFSTSARGPAYALLMVVNDQQWLLLPLLIWALANDTFTVASAKRLFPVLGIALLCGGIAGNLLSAGFGRIFGSGTSLLLLNAALILTASGLLMLSLRRISPGNRQMRSGERVLDSLREGLAFVREVPVFRYLTLSMILLGVGLNAIEFEFLSAVSRSFPVGSDMQAFYGAFKGGVTVGLLIVQSVLAGWLLQKAGFRHIFLSLPVAMAAALCAALLSPSLLVVALSNAIVRITKIGLDEPSIKAFQGLVPDERRGRVAAFLDGYLFPFGSIIGCVLIFSATTFSDAGLIAPSSVRVLVLAVALSAALAALASAVQIGRTYDASMLNWRLKRRRRDSAADALEPAPDRRRSSAALLDTLISSEPVPAPVTRRPRPDVLSKLDADPKPPTHDPHQPSTSSD